MKRSEAIDQLREMDAKYSCYVYCKNELAVVLGEQGQKLNRTLSSLVSAKALVRAARGVYVFAYSKLMPSMPKLKSVMASSEYSQSRKRTAVSTSSQFVVMAVATLSVSSPICTSERSPPSSSVG